MTNKELEKRIENLEKQLKDTNDELFWLIDFLEIRKENWGAEPKPHHEFKVGDRVQFKSWEEMEREFGLNDYNSTILCYYPFIREMKHLCGTYATINKIIDDIVVELKDFTADGDIQWNYSLDMFKPATDEPKGRIKTTEWDLSELRNPKCKFKVGDRVKVRCYGNATKCTITEINGNKATIFIDETTEFGGSTYSITEDITDLEPYTEPRWTFTDDEKVILRNLPETYKWIARDENGNLYIHHDKPNKCGESWHSNEVIDLLTCFYHLFQSIKWSDDEPCEFRKYL